MMQLLIDAEWYAVEYILGFPRLSSRFFPKFVLEEIL
jgi:hypothetical protein